MIIGSPFSVASGEAHRSITDVCMLSNLREGAASVRYERGIIKLRYDGPVLEGK
ncbi:hypothetical protein SAMN05216559_0945 [Halomicrobium zhouii]|uniref:Uncharacterized protein n=1 Tax=Halomicrobium zhouii TaxID=767519 RepID=A0A1I6KL48_9EURY|nr:hypothetical protein SAMN05216559_0945 [Halomicrobium zhouii]